MRYILSLLAVLLLCLDVSAQQGQVLRTAMTTNVFMNPVQNQWVPFWNSVANKWSNAPPSTALATNAQPPSAVLTNLSATSAITNANANQFGSTATFITIKDGALITNASIRAITMPNLTADRAMAINASGNLTNSVTTLAELSFVSGVTGGIQTNINNRVSIEALNASSNAVFGAKIDIQSGFGNATTITNLKSIYTSTVFGNEMIGTNLFVTNNVFIYGSTTNAGTLNVAGQINQTAPTDSQLYMRGGNTFSPIVFMDEYGVGGSFSAPTILLQNANGTVVAPTKITTGNLIGNVFIAGRSGSGANYNGALLMQAYAMSDFAASASETLVNWSIGTSSSGITPPVVWTWTAASSTNTGELHNLSTIYGSSGVGLSMPGALRFTGPGGNITDANGNSRFALSTTDNTTEIANSNRTVYLQIGELGATNVGQMTFPSGGRSLALRGEIAFTGPGGHIADANGNDRFDLSTTDNTTTMYNSNGTVFVMVGAAGVTNNGLLVVTGKILVNGAGSTFASDLTVNGAFIANDSLRVPRGASITTDDFGELGADNNFLGVNRGALQFYDGTDNTFLVGITNTPTDLQVPVYNATTKTWSAQANTSTPSIITNGNQFGASVTLTIKNGALVTNLVARGVTVPTVTADRAAGFNASGDLTNSTTTLAELAFVNGVTSAIQTQLNGKIGGSTNGNQFGANATTLTIKDGPAITNAALTGTAVITNAPGTSGGLRLSQTNGFAFTEIAVPAQWLATNRYVFWQTNAAANKVLKVNSVSISSGIATINITNDFVAGTEVTFSDPDNKFVATDVTSALAELNDVNGSGPNASDGKVSWTQLVGVPSGFADGSDDGGTNAVAFGVGTIDLTNAVKRFWVNLGADTNIVLNWAKTNYYIASPSNSFTVTFANAPSAGALAQSMTLEIINTNSVSGIFPAPGLNGGSIILLSAPSTNFFRFNFDGANTWTESLQILTTGTGDTNVFNISPNLITPTNVNPTIVDAGGAKITYDFGPSFTAGDALVLHDATGIVTNKTVVGSGGGPQVTNVVQFISSSTNVILDLGLASSNHVVFKVGMTTNSHVVLSNALLRAYPVDIVWQQDTNGNRSILSIRSTDGLIQTNFGALVLTTNANAMDIWKVSAAFFTSNVVVDIGIENRGITGTGEWVLATNATTVDLQLFGDPFVRSYVTYNVSSGITGTGGALTNFSFTVSGAEFPSSYNIINAGLTNVNIVAIMGGASTRMQRGVFVFTNRTATPRTLSLSATTNSWTSRQKYTTGTQAPFTITNGLGGRMEWELVGTNVVYSYEPIDIPYP